MNEADSDRDSYLRHLLSAESALRGYILAHVRDFHTAEDVLQQTALILWQKFGDYDPGRSFLAWALGMARLEIQNARRRARQVGILMDNRLADLVASEYVAAETELAGRRQLLRACVDRLSGSMKEAMRLRYETGSGLDAIAAQLGKSMSAIKVLLHRARLCLKRCVALHTPPREASS